MFDLSLEISKKSNAELAAILDESQGKGFPVSARLVSFCCDRVGWRGISAPYGDWNYPHCVTKTGGVVPYSFDGLIDELKEN